MTDKRANCEHKLYPLQHVDNKDKCDYCGTPVDVPHEPLDAWKPIFVNGVIPDEFRAWIANECSKARDDIPQQDGELRKPCFCPAVTVKGKPTPHTHVDGTRLYSQDEVDKLTAKAYEARQRATLLDASAYEQGYAAGRIAEGKTCEAAGRHDYRRAVIDAQIQQLIAAAEHFVDYPPNFVYYNDRLAELEAQKAKLNRNPALKETSPTEVTRANTALNSPKSEGDNHAKS